MKLDEVYQDQDNRVDEVPSFAHDLFESSVKGVKGISPQAVDDLVKVATELKPNFSAFQFFNGIVSIFTKKVSSLIFQKLAIVMMFAKL